MLFLGCLFRKSDEDIILKLSKMGLSNASNTFQWNLINGLEKITNIKIINVLPVGTYPNQYKQLFLKSKSWTHGKNFKNIEIGSINLPFLKQWSRARKIKKEIVKSIDTGQREDIIIYSTYLPFLKAIYSLDKNINIILIVTDLPEFYDLGNTSIIKKVLRKINNYYIYKYMERVDSFILLTEKMKEPLKVGKRPYHVMEGIANEKSTGLEYGVMDSGKKIILYTGTLHYQFGIGMLLQAFRLIEDNSYELWLCGAGDAEEEIKQLAELDKRVKFWGYLTKADIDKVQQQATVLINPRPNEGEYTKYSFPSKTMEYLMSGKPVIMYKLDGIPQEYNQYIHYIAENNPEKIAEKIKAVCEDSEENRVQFGERARRFILENKNSDIQAQKIMEFICTGNV